VVTPADTICWKKITTSFKRRSNVHERKSVGLTYQSKMLNSHNPHDQNEVDERDNPDERDEKIQTFLLPSIDTELVHNLFL